MIVVENVGRVDEVACGVNMNPINSLLDVENVHVQCGSNLSKNDDVELVLYKFKFSNGIYHMVRHQLIGAFSLSMTNCLLILKIHKCFDDYLQVYTCNW